MDSNLVTIITGKGREETRGSKTTIYSREELTNNPQREPNDPTSHRFDLQLKIWMKNYFSEALQMILEDRLHHVNYLVSFFNMQFWVIVGQF